MGSGWGHRCWRTRTRDSKPPAVLTLKSLCERGGAVVVADSMSDRIMEWQRYATSGRVLSGGNGDGNRLEQLHSPTHVIWDKDTYSVIVCDRGNRRLIRWSLRSSTRSGATIVDHISCHGFVMDDEGSLDVTDTEKQEVRRYRRGKTVGTAVAGGHGQGAGLHQLNLPICVSVDGEHSVYVSDNGNHRVMKWEKGAKEGTLVAGGQGEKGMNLTQLSDPHGLLIDATGTVYIADSGNDRVIRWCCEATRGTVVVVGGNRAGLGQNQLNDPTGSCFDRHGNLYVADWGNHRVQRFSIEKIE